MEQGNSEEVIEEF